MPELQFWLLDGFQVWRGDVHLDPTVPGQRALTLLALLVTERNRHVSTDYIIDRLWPHLNLDAAANNVQVAVRKLRRWLEPELKRGVDSHHLITESGGYRFQAAACTIDVDEFVQACQQGEAAKRARDLAAARTAWERARGLYRREFLIGWPYAEWAIPHRERLRERHLQLLEDLAGTYLQLALHTEAIQVCRQALAIDALHEGCVRLLLQSHAARGQHGEALAIYAEYEALLQDELGVEPALETQALRDAIVTGATPRPEVGTPPQGHPLLGAVELPLVGRTQALETLSTAWQERSQRATASGPGVVLIAGEAGIGKTRLLAEWAATIESPVLWSRAQENDPPFAVAINLLDAYLRLRPAPSTLASLGPLGAPLAERLPALRRQWPACPPYTLLAADAEQERLYQAILAALRLATAEPTLLVLDDMQWSDAASLAVLSDLCRSPSLPALLLLAYRQEEVTANQALAHWLAQQQQAGQARRLELAGLTDADVFAAVRTVTDLPDPSHLSRRLHAVTAGHPLFLTETLRGLIDAGQLYRDMDGVWRITETALDPELDDKVGTRHHQLPLSSTLHEAILARARRLTSFQREILEVASILHRAWQAATVVAILDADVDQVERALAVLAGSRLLVKAKEPGAWEFSHHLIGDAIYTDLSDSHRRLLHRLAARSLADACGEQPNEMAGEIVAHLQQGEGQAGTLTKWAVLAGQWAYQRFAHVQALAYFELAGTQLAQMPEPQQSPDLALNAWEGLALVQQQLGQSKAALETLSATLPLAHRPADRVRLLLRMARICMRDTAEHDRSKSLIDQAEAILSEADLIELEARAEGHAIRAYVHYHQGDYRDGERMARLALSETRNTFLELQALQALALNLHKIGQIEEALRLYRQVLHAHEESGDLRSLGPAYNNLGIGLHTIGRLHEALAAYARCSTLAQQLRDRRRLCIADTNLGMTVADIGDLPRAEAALKRAIEVAQTVDAPYTVAVARHLLGRTLTWRGHWQAAQTEFEAAMALAHAIEARVVEAQARVHYALWHWARQQATAAASEAQTALAVGEQTGDNLCRRETRLLLGAIALAQGDAAAAEALARAAWSVAVAGGQHLAQGRAERLLGEIACADRDLPAAQRHLDESERIFRTSGASLELGVTLLARTDCERSAARDQRRTWLVEARRLFRRARAVPYLKQAEQRLRLLDADSSALG